MNDHFWQMCIFYDLTLVLIELLIECTNNKMSLFVGVLCVFEKVIKITFVRGQNDCMLLVTITISGSNFTQIKL